MQGAEGLAASAAEAVATRDAVRANLLDLDASFGKRMLEGAALDGVTRREWDGAAAKLAGLWQTFAAYSAVIDRVAGLAQAGAKREPAELSRLLRDHCVVLTQTPAPLAHRDVADTGRRELTLTGAVAVMRAAFSEITRVTAAAETVWNDAGSRLDTVAGLLASARRLLSGLPDEGIAARLAGAAGSLEAQRAALNSDPLALWRVGNGDPGGHAGRADTSAADRLAGDADALLAEVTALDRLRREWQGRIGQLRAQADALAAARQDAVRAWQRAADRIAGVPPLPPESAPPLQDLAALAAAGRWRQLAADLGRSEAALATAISQTRDTERSLVCLISRRDELRGLLDAYKAKAARLGSAADPGLTARYDHARRLLWTAPCDLTVAADAVSGYQRAIVSMKGQRR